MKRLCVSLLVCVWCLLSPSAGEGARPANSESSASKRVQDALRSEIDGSIAARNRLLKTALHEKSAGKGARWHSGQVLQEGEWIDYSRLPDRLSEQDAIARYRQLRGQFSMTYEDQLKLANWCRQQKLPQREQAHLTVALELSENPNDPDLRSRLGFVLEGGIWTTRANIQAAKKDRITNRKHFKAWLPKIQRLVRSLESSRAAVREKARENLRNIKDPAAMPALEHLLANAELEKAMLLVDVLGGMNTFQAAEPLSRLAVLSEWKVVREAAAEKLRVQPVGAYTPHLLASMRTPVESRVNLFVDQGGARLTHELTSETHNARQVLRRRSSTFILSDDLSLQTGDRSQNRRDRAIANVELDAKLQARAVEQDLERQNNRIGIWNERVCAALSTATGVELPAEPSQWWEWWEDYNQLTDEPKEYQYSYAYETRTYDSSTAPIQDTSSRFPLSGGSSRCECLVAGTPVWTDQGFVAIEAVEVGDLVLAKHPESGELRYQPVIRTTIRDEEPIWKAKTNHGEIRATGGHTFWISGEGWTKLRDIKPMQRLHGVKGPAIVQSLQTDGQEKTYNLVVADYHTYFVGEEMVLSHDLTFARPTDVLVPGLAAE